LHPPPLKAGRKPDEAWADAVVSNVNDQVRFALTHFSARIHEGKLTVVGAVYDFRNDLGQGAGKLVIVNVNGTSDPERLSSFREAIHVGREAKSSGAEKAKKNGGGAEREPPRFTGDPVNELNHIVGGHAEGHTHGAEAVVAASDVHHDGHEQPEAHGAEH
jgi:hypothetical protein